MTNEELVSMIQAGDNVNECMSVLYENNKDIITQAAMKIPGESEDLTQEGYFGLYEAALHFDEGQGASFSIYCRFWIRQAMQRYIENNGSIRIPVYAGNLVKRYDRAYREYLQEYGVEPSEGVVCELLGVNEDKLETIKQNRLYDQIHSLEEPIGEDGALLSDVIPSDEDVEGDIVRGMDGETMRTELWKAVDNLPGDLPDIIRQRYEDGKTLVQIADAKGKSASGVRMDLQKGEKLLRNNRRNQGYVEYYREYLEVVGHHVGVEKFQRTGISAVEEIVLNKVNI